MNNVLQLTVLTIKIILNIVENICTTIEYNIKFLKSKAGKQIIQYFYFEL